MEVKKELVYQYAIKGITQEIQELDKEIKLGCKYLEERCKGNVIDNLKLNDYELDKAIKDLTKKMKELEEIKTQFKWELI